MGGKKIFELTLEIGHKSQLLKSKLPNGYTHKWTVFLKGANDSKLEHCIQRVVFHLHDSFPIPHREISEPPFQVKETGYAGFEIPIDIYFKNRDKLEQNRVEFTHDLVLLVDGPNHISRLEKLKFHNPSREFERCLVKAGAQLLSVSKKKKDRSVSPPTKKQKSYSLIPSKDMSNKQAGQQAQTHSRSNNNSHSYSSSASLTSHNSILPSSHQNQQQNHHKSNSSSHLNHNNHGGSYNNQSHSNNNHTNIGNHNSSNSLFGNSNQSNHQTIKRSSQQPSSVLPKPKSSSSELMDVFGAPLVYNNSKSQKTSNGKDHSSDHNHRDVPMITSNNSSPIPPPPAVRQPSPQVSTQQSHKTLQSHSHHHKSSKHHHHHHKKHHHIKQEPQAETLRTPPPPPPPSAQLHVPKKTSQKEPPTQQAVAFIAQADPFQMLQNKISSLTDTDRLQKIVDIIEESGEWFNLTPNNKFEFDLKRLDKKTISKIEKCLP